MNAALSDELLSINAIYDPETLTSVDKHDDTCILRLPSSAVSLRISFPADYPEQSPPRILGSEGSGSESRKGEASEVVALARATLEGCFRQGDPCMFDLIEELSEKLQARNDDVPDDEVTTQGNATQAEVEWIYEQQPHLPQSSLSDTVPQWVLSEAVSEKKSVFLGRAATVTSVEEAQSFIEHLVTTDKKAAKATHNISAWRIRDASTGATFKDSDDDGETAAGGRLLQLLQVMDAWNVVVVVSRYDICAHISALLTLPSLQTRWYGGIQLGPNRFRLINNVAKDALCKGNFTVDSMEQNRAKGKK